MSRDIETSIPCPFVYSNGKACKGVIYRVVAYGPPGRGGCVERHKVRKYRLHCSEKGDHAGVVISWEGKVRMEFYPDQLPEGVEDMLWSGRATYDGKPLRFEA